MALVHVEPVSDSFFAINVIKNFEGHWLISFFAVMCYPLKIKSIDWLNNIIILQIFCKDCKQREQFLTVDKETTDSMNLFKVETERECMPCLCICEIGNNGSEKNTACTTIFQHKYYCSPSSFCHTLGLLWTTHWKCCVSTIALTTVQNCNFSTSLWCSLQNKEFIWRQ